MSVERRLARILAERHPQDAGRVLERLSPESAASTLERLPPEVAGGALRHLEPAFAASCLAGLGEEASTAMLSTLPIETIAHVAGRLPGPERERILERLPRELAEPVRLLMQYAEDTAGGLMDPGVPALRVDRTAGEARKRLRQLPRGILYYLYVVDREQRLVGVINLRELMIAPASQPLSALMRPSVVSLSVHARREGILAHPGWRDFHALPVVDGNGALRGVLRYETLRRLESEASPRASRDSLLLVLGDLYLSAASALLEGAMAGVTRAGRGASKEQSDGD